MNTAVLLLTMACTPGTDPVPAQAYTPGRAGLAAPADLTSPVEGEMSYLAPVAAPPSAERIATLGPPITEDVYRFLSRRSRPVRGEIVPVVAYSRAEEQAPARRAVPAAPARATPAGANAMPAKLVVQIPEGGRLFIDGRFVEVSPGPNTLYTPPLAVGQTYFYVLRAEAVRGGQLLRQTTRVILEPGLESWVRFPQLESVATLSWGEPDAGRLSQDEDLPE